MIEQAMYFALGWLGMGLMGLLLLPFYKRRTLRLSRRQIEAQMPLSMHEIVAQRDVLRAEFALATRKIEQKSADIQEAHAADRIAMGHQSCVIHALGLELGGLKTTFCALETAYAGAQRDKDDAQAQAAAMTLALHDADGQIARLGARLTSAAQHNDEFQQHIDSQRTTIAALETQATGLNVRLEDHQRLLAKAQAAQLERAGAMLAIQAKLAEASQQAEAARQQLVRLTARHEKARLRIEHLQQALNEERQQHDATAADATGHATRARDVAAALATAHSREQELADRLQFQNAGIDATDASLVASVETLRMEAASLRGALDTARAENARLRLAVPPPAAENPDDLVVLRSAIADIGATMARMASTLEHNGDALPLAEKMRHLQAQIAR